MKRIFTVIIFMVPTIIFAQWTLVAWDFSGDPPDTKPTEATPENADWDIWTEGASDIQFKNGYENKAAQASEWDNGVGTKCWKVACVTTGAADITISSRQQSGGEDSGPRDWKVQYSTGNPTEWFDIPGGTYQVANDWETGYISDLVLPEECNDEDLIFIRWIITSDTNLNGELLDPAGKNKIDDITIKAYTHLDVVEHGQITQKTVWPNPAVNYLQVDVAYTGFYFQLLDITGKVWHSGIIQSTGKIDASFVPTGSYILVFSDGKSRKTAKIQIKRDC